MDENSLKSSSCSNVYTQIHDDGTNLTHSHSGHTHTHPPEETRAIENRLSRAIGHLESVKRMVSDGRDCSEVLIQLAAVKSALNQTGLLILQNHINHCIVEAVQTGDMETVEDLNRAIKLYFK